MGMYNAHHLAMAQYHDFIAQREHDIQIFADKEDAYTMYVHANEKYCNALNEFNDVKSKYSIKD